MVCGLSLCRNEPLHGFFTDSMNENINIDSTIADSMNDNINMDSTIADSMNDKIYIITMNFYSKIIRLNWFGKYVLY
jgi:hypothetical protein